MSGALKHALLRNIPELEGVECPSCYSLRLRFHSGRFFHFSLLYSYLFTRFIGCLLGFSSSQVCNAIVRGDLTQKITNVESVSSEMSSLVVTINDMVDQLSSFSGEVKKVAQDIRTEGNLNVRVEIGNAQGIWQETACVSCYLISQSFSVD